LAFQYVLCLLLVLTTELIHASAGLRSLVVGTAFLPTQQPQRPLSFSFRLHTLTLHNNHWQSLSPTLLSQLLLPARPDFSRDETTSTIRHLDLSSTYDVASFGPFLEPFVPSDHSTDSHIEATHLSALSSLLLPPFETSDHLFFASTALSSCSPSHLSYLELPPLSSATSGVYDVLWARLSELFAAGGVAEVGLRGYATIALVETAKAVLAAAGADSGRTVGEGLGGLRRLRFCKLLAVEEVGKVAGGAEMLEVAEQYGAELICGARIVE
jgi:hypothetical protein